jgi:hypothetical protein
MNPPKAAQSASSKTNKEKFTELTDYMIKYKAPDIVKAEVVKIDNQGFTYKEITHLKISKILPLAKHELLAVVNYDEATAAWQMSIYVNGRCDETLEGTGWEELLKALGDWYNVPKQGSPEYISLTESFSIADDFKLYESLWG